MTNMTLEPRIVMMRMIRMVKNMIMMMVMMRTRTMMMMMIMVMVMLLMLLLMMMMMMTMTMMVSDASVFLRVDWTEEHLQMNYSRCGNELEP